MQASRVTTQRCHTDLLAHVLAWRAATECTWVMEMSSVYEAGWMERVRGDEGEAGSLDASRSTGV